MAASNRSIMVGGKKKMITIDVHGEEDEEEQRSGNVSRVKTIELRGPRAREMYRKERVKYVVAPRHHRAMHTLYMHNPSFGPSVRLCRRWLHSMMLSDAYEHEVSSFFLCCWMLCGDALWMLCGMLMLKIFLFLSRFSRFFCLLISSLFALLFVCSSLFLFVSQPLSLTTTTNLCTGH